MGIIVAPAAATSAAFRVLSSVQGASRIQSTTLRPSFNWQWAARATSESAMPAAILPSVLAEHGIITMPAVATDPDAIVAVNVCPVKFGHEVWVAGINAG